MSKGKLSWVWRFSLLGLSVLLMLLDQLSKSYARTSLSLFQPHEFLPHWNWTLIYNEGAAFSFLANQGGWQKIIFSRFALIVAMGIIYFLICKTYTKLIGLAFSLILSGALGNVVDRLLHGKVTDFIDWYWGSYHWPAFNLADSCITVGVCLLIIDGIFYGKQ
jgi:signal peptidase II